MFSTRNAPRPTAAPPRSLPAWSDVPGRILPLADARAAWRRPPMVTETSPHPDEPGGGGEFSERQRSGCEHGSTVASTVVASEARLTDETNDRGNAAATDTPAIFENPTAARVHPLVRAQQRMFRAGYHAAINAQAALTAVF